MERTRRVLAQLLAVASPACPGCGVARGSPLCAACAQASGVAASVRVASIGSLPLLFAGSYHDRGGLGLSPLGRALHAFKDRGDRHAGRMLSRLFATLVAPQALGFDVAVPVPPDLARLRQRSFSPSAWLTRELARRSGLAWSTTALQRVPGRPPQRGLDGRRRRENARGAFRVGRGRVRGYAVLLVDDVVTTGATLLDAAARLVESGASSVTCAVLACADEDLAHPCRSRTGNAGTNDTASRPG